MKFANICPVCRKTLTKGVEQRVEELADRPGNYQPNNTIGCLHLLPLSEIIAAVHGSDSPSTQKIWSLYNSLIQKFGDEYTILIDAPKEAISDVAGESIAETILRVRQGTAKVIPGYDGVYGKLIVPSQVAQPKNASRRVQQLNLTDFTS
jgi:DNA helicase-2/ATP-dependent DNA helicase PcrA